MGFLRINCEACGGSWEVYRRDSGDKARQCPHCGAKIDRNVWERFVIPAFASVNEANLELFKENAERHRALFTFDVIADHLYQNRKNDCPLTETLREFEDFIRG